MTTKEEEYEANGFEMPPPENKKKFNSDDGLNFIILLSVACILVAFVFIVLGNLAGTALAAALGIGSYAVG